MKTIEPIPTLALYDLLHMAASAIEDLLEHTDPNTSYYSGMWADVPGKLRSAMLQAGNSPVIPEWIPVSERMPEKNGTYQVWNGEHVGAVPFLFGSFQCLNPKQVTHWMPTAKPPREVK